LIKELTLSFEKSEKEKEAQQDLIKELTLNLEKSEKEKEAQ
jgi:hypothetical protein